MSAATSQTVRDPRQRRLLGNRLHRIEGQVRGVERMLAEGRSCVDVLTQIAAIRTALDSFALRLLDDHVTRCLRADHDEDLLAAIRRYTQTH